MKFIESMREGERVAGVYLCKFYQPSLTKNGKPYIHLNLQDKTGVIDAKIWDPNSQGIEDFGALDYVDIMGDVTSFQGMPQLNIKRARRAQEGEYQPGDYLPMSAKDIGEMYQELLRYVSSIQNEWLRQLLESFFVRDKAFAQRFQVAELLAQGSTYDGVREKVPTSYSTITRINTELRYGAGGYQMVLDRLKPESERKQEPSQETVKNFPFI